MFEGGETAENDEEEDDEDTVDVNVVFASCDLVGVFAKVYQSSSLHETSM